MNARTRRRFRAANANLRKLRGPLGFRPNEQLRLFVALELPDDWKQAIGRFMERIRSTISRDSLTRDLRIRWIKPEELHVTLKFIGEVTPDRLQAIDQALKSVAIRQPAFTLEYNDVGSFIDRHSPHAVWLSVSEPGGSIDSLLSLVGSIEASFEPVGFPREKRPFLPHVTLARLPLNMSTPAKERLLEVAKTVQQPTLRTLEVEHISLLRSHEGAQGTWYERLQTYPSPTLQGGWQPI